MKTITILSLTKASVELPWYIHTKNSEKEQSQND